jgi:aspartate carbamoyltransferase catalytic subunit
MTSLLRHIVSVSDVSIPVLGRIFSAAESIKRNFGQDPFSDGRIRLQAILQGAVVATIFYEPSTRTRLCFESAALRLGASVIGTENAGEFSSAIKGETLADTVRIVAGYADLLVLRHPARGSATEAAGLNVIPVINAGDGDGEHPTQALLDYFTIMERAGEQSQGSLTCVGDLRYGRTVHSLLRLVAGLRGTSLERITSINLVAPPDLHLPEALVTTAEQAGVKVQVHHALTEGVLQKSDFLYLTRVQKERGAVMVDPTAFALTLARAKQLPSSATIMHPLPRNAELPTELDSLPQAQHFAQAQNGLFVRMALLIAILRAEALEGLGA